MNIATRAGLLCVALILAVERPSAARPEVTPKPKDAAVVLEAGKHSPPKASGDSAAPVSAPSEYDFREFSECQVDPVVGNYGCRTDEPADPDDEPELTPGDVLRAVREIGLPSLEVKIEPGGETLVNVPTIFHAEPQPFERSVTLLDFDVDLVAEPVAYRWVHGDGSIASTDQPGRPYPAMDITHRYDSPADDVQARVDVTYQVRFRVDGGPWQTIGQTLVAAGPPAALDVKDAAPVLTTSRVQE